MKKIQHYMLLSGNKTANIYVKTVQFIFKNFCWGDIVVREIKLQIRYHFFTVAEFPASDFISGILLTKANF